MCTGGGWQCFCRYLRSWSLWDVFQVLLGQEKGSIQTFIPVKSHTNKYVCEGIFFHELSQSRPFQFLVLLWELGMLQNPGEQDLCSIIQAQRTARTGIQAQDRDKALQKFLLFFRLAGILLPKPSASLCLLALSTPGLEGEGRHCWESWKS